MKLILKLGLIVAIAFMGWQYFGSGTGAGEGTGAEAVTITEVQKWQDDQGEWHFSNSGEELAESETVEYRSDRNVIKVDYVEQLEAQQSTESKPGPKTDNQPIPTSRITTVQQGINALQQAGDVQGVLDQRADQQEKQLESYR